VSPRTVFLCLFLGLLLTSLAPAQTADFYVATDGNDSWSGTLPAPNAGKTDGPFATIPRAQTAVRNILGNPGGRTTPITVMIRQGTYWQSQALQFDSSDAGTSQLKVIWENYPSENPVISGGTQLKNWTNVSGNEWQVSLSKTTQNFEQLFYNGQRRLRPRLGSSTSNVGTYYRVLNTVFVSGSPPPSPPPDPNCPLYISGSGWECFDRFQYNSSDPISNSWQNLAPPAGNHCGQPAGNPNLVGDIELVIFELWLVSKLRISCIDTSNQIIYLTGPTSSSNAGYQRILPNHRYLIENIKDDLQQPGQWFLDRSTTSWVLTYLANSGEDPNTDTVVIPQAGQVLVASQLQNVTFQGLRFENDNFVVPSAGYQSNSLDNGITAAVSCQNCQNVIFDSDIVTQTSGNGLEFISCINTESPSWCVGTSATGTSSNNTIENSAFYDIGGSGIRVGSPSSWTDTDSTVPQFFTVQNNVVEGVGRTFPSTYAIWQGSGHDNTYTHNDVYDGYHSAIGICDGGCIPGVSNSKGTFNITISFNHVYNLMQGILNDSGALYMNTGDPTFIATGNQILNNKVHDVTDAGIQDAGGYGGFGIKLDSHTGLVNVENNLVYRTTDEPMSQTCGPQIANSPNTIKNNVFSFTRLQVEGIVCSAPAGVSQFSFTNNLVFFSHSQVQWGCAYCTGTNCLPSVQNYSSNMYCDITTPACTLSATPFKTTNSACSQTLQQLSWSGWQGLGEDLTSQVANPLFVNPFYPTDNFALQNGSPASQIGFVPFDVNAPGRTSDNIQPPAIAATFPTVAYQAAVGWSLTPSQNPATYGQPVTLTASLSSPWGPPPDGTEITFTDTSTGQNLGTSSLTQGSASLQVSGLTAGPHWWTGSFNATAFWPSSTSYKAWLQVQKASSTTTIKSSPNPSAYGQSITFSATVTGSGGTPTGTVQFKAGSSYLGTATLSSDVATLKTSTVPVGTWSVTANYLGDSNFLASTSASLNQTVNLAASITTLTSSPNPSTKGQKVTFTATVKCLTATPPGEVTFKSGSTTLGNRWLSSGVATLSTTNLPTGTDPITAIYNGNQDVAGSTSKVLNQVVNQ
jgi:Bacterial Ig-like domain (group 3)